MDGTLQIQLSRVGLAVMGMKKYSTFLISPELEPHHRILLRMLVMFSNLRGNGE